MEIEYWHWMILGFGLLAAEMLLPTGFILLWVGVAAVVTGAFAWMAPSVSWEAEFALWGALSVVAVLAWRKYMPVGAPSDRPMLNRRAHSIVGRSFTLADPIVDGVGKLRVDDSQWRISGPDAPIGTHVKVIAADGSTLKVERVDPR